MSNFTPIIERAREAATLHDKSQLLTYLGLTLSSSKKKLATADKRELGDFALSELELIPELLDKEESYRGKDEIFGLMDSLMNLVMICYDSPAALPRDKVEMIQRVVDRCNRERFLERAIDEAFDGQPDAADMERILCMAAPLKDEFHKGQLWRGLLEYKGKVARLSEEAKIVLAKYAVSELDRYAEARKKEALTQDMLGSLELLCDAVKYLLYKMPPSRALTTRLTDLFSLNNPDISYYTLSTLLSARCEVPDEVIGFLARNPVMANMTYQLLKTHVMTDRFPAELRDPVYLAKSDLVHWLTYPTELGKEPDEIEYIGKAQKKGETFHIFRYKSDSNNLGDDLLRGVWLIGWSGSDGGTFSNFDRYVDFEKKTPEKTVKYICRKLL